MFRFKSDDKDNSAWSKVEIEWKGQICVLVKGYLKLFMFLFTDFKYDLLKDDAKQKPYWN